MFGIVLGSASIVVRKRFAGRMVVGDANSCHEGGNAGRNPRAWAAKPIDR